MSSSDADKKVDFEALSAIIDDWAQQMIADSTEWFGKESAIDIIEKVLGLNGEAGEAADVIKKFLRGSLTWEEAGPLFAEELVDVIIYVVICAKLINFDIVDGYIEKRQFNKERFSRNEDSNDHTPLASEVSRAQRTPLGAAAFVSGQSLQHTVHRGTEG